MGLVIFAVLFALSMILRGGSLDVFWDWFIVNTGIWPDAPDLTMATGLGLSFFVGFLWWRHSPSDNKTLVGEDWGEVLGRAIGLTVVSYAWFWLVALFLHYFLNVGA